MNQSYDKAVYCALRGHMDRHPSSQVNAVHDKLNMCMVDEKHCPAALQALHLDPVGPAGPCPRTGGPVCHCNDKYQCP